jgi:hypothetical protein
MIAICYYALPQPADKTGRTSEQIASIDTSPTSADLAGWAFDIVTTHSVIAKAFFTDLSTGTLACATGSRADPVGTSDTVWTWRAIVDLAIAIIVQTVADIGTRLLSLATCPLAIDAAVKAVCTSRLAGSNQIFIDLTIAIIIFAVADLK